MARRLILSSGVASIDGALLEDGVVTGLLRLPALGDEDLPRRPMVGERRAGRVAKRVPGLGGVFVDVGDLVDALAPDAPAGLSEGSAIEVEIVRAPIGAKGALAKIAPSGARSDASHPLVRHLRSRMWQADEILVDDPAMHALLGGAGLATHLEPERVAEAALADSFAEALSRVVALPEGARCVIDETEGGTVVDIDAGAAAAGAGRIAERVNALAARAVMSALRRRGVGGRIVIDFLPPSGAAARDALAADLKSAIARWPGARAGRLSADGLFDLTAPRPGPSLLEQASEPAGEGWLRPGRRPTTDWRLKDAIAEACRRADRNPRVRLELRLGADLAAHLAERTRWGDRLAARYGPRIVVSRADKLLARDHAVDEKP